MTNSDLTSFVCYSNFKLPQVIMFTDLNIPGSGVVYFQHIRGPGSLLKWFRQ